MGSEISLGTAQKVAEAVVSELRPDCQKIEVAGSIRRRRPWVHDIDIVVIPKDYWNFYQHLRGLGTLTMSGQKIMRATVPSLAGPVQVDCYVATAENWATLLLIKTGSAQSNIRLASRAKARGWHLAASGDGLFNEKGERIAGDSELSIFNALGLPYKEPWERN